MKPTIDTIKAYTYKLSKLGNSELWDEQSIQEHFMAIEDYEYHSALEVMACSEITKRGLWKQA